MPVADIKELRLLPPLALGRVGSSDEAMHNYDLLPSATPAGFRQLSPAATLVVDPQSGNVNQVTPAAVTFRDGASRIKPVAPFLELWGRFADDGQLEPVTLATLNDLGLTAASVRWEIVVGNLKMFRRTGDVRDRITTTLQAAALEDHARHELLGSGTNLKPGARLSLGWGQYVRPSPAFPEIRFRFTPARGFVFGHTAGPSIPAARAIYNASAGGWDTFDDNFQPNNPTPRARIFTSPAGIFARSRPPQSVNLGFFDDTCDGIVRATIILGAKTLTAIARISSGPPDFAPDSLPVRSVLDDFEQMALGPDVTSVTADEVIDIVRRAVETIRLMNTETQNASFPFWVPTAQPIFGPVGARYATTRALHEGFLQALEGLKASASTPARSTAVAVLEQIVRVLRDPDDSLDYTTTGPAGQRPPAQRMPAFMRGSDGGLLALTRRQQNILRQAIEQFRPTSSGGNSPVEAMTRMIQVLASFATLHSAITLPGGGTLSSLFANPQQLLAYLANPTSTATGSVAASLGLGGRQLVVPRDPANSALFQFVTDPNHPMEGPISVYQDTVTGDDGVTVVRNWINSL
jgi:hypothetical protein